MLFYTCFDGDTNYLIDTLSRSLRADGIVRNLDEPMGHLKL
jgi:hypothetical protein